MKNNDYGHEPITKMSMDAYEDLTDCLDKINALTKIAIGNNDFTENQTIYCHLLIVQDYMKTALKICNSMKFTNEI